MWSFASGASRQLIVRGESLTARESPASSRWIHSSGIESYGEGLGSSGVSQGKSFKVRRARAVLKESSQDVESPTPARVPKLPKPRLTNKEVLAKHESLWATRPWQKRLEKQLAEGRAEAVIRSFVEKKANLSTPLDSLGEAPNLPLVSDSESTAKYKKQLLKYRQLLIRPNFASFMTAVDAYIMTGRFVNATDLFVELLEIGTKDSSQRAFDITTLAAANATKQVLISLVQHHAPGDEVYFKIFLSRLAVIIPRYISRDVMMVRKELNSTNTTESTLAHHLQFLESHSPHYNQRWAPLWLEPLNIAIERKDWVTSTVLVKEAKKYLQTPSDTSLNTIIRGIVASHPKNASPKRIETTIQNIKSLFSGKADHPHTVPQAFPEALLELHDPSHPKHALWKFAQGVFLTPVEASPNITLRDLDSFTDIAFPNAPKLANSDTPKPL